MENSKKTLLIVPIGLGNFIMATPAIQLLSEQIGRKNLFLLALKPGIKQCAEAGEWFEHIFCWDPDKESKLKGLKILKDLRKERIHCSLSLFPTSHWKFSLFTFLAGLSERRGFLYPEAKIPTWIQTYSHPLQKLHDVDQNLSLIKHYLKYTEPVNKQLIFPFPLSHPEALDLTEAKYFVCHPGSSLPRGMEKKRLAPPKFADLILRIYHEWGLKCILIGGPEEEELRMTVAADCSEALLNYSSKSLSELGALIQCSQFFVGNDSGLMHFSVALQKRCIAFFGPSDEGRTGPYHSEGKNLHLVLRNQTEPLKTISSQSPRTKYTGSGGLEELGIEAVWPKVKSFVSGFI